MSTMIAGVFFVLSFIFVATSLDSAAFTMARSIKNIAADEQPARWHRLVWAFVLSGTALSLMFLGGLEILQTASIIVGCPLLIVMLLMVRSFMKSREAGG